MIGKTVSHYPVIEKIGAGGMGSASKNETPVADLERLNLGSMGSRSEPGRSTFRSYFF
jgi:hypothetical protein